ncbi:unnamed protein product [Peronospora destructor]|uniref:COMM domain-containing protein n=1 Tax=Peronospora destructor TaxID=86335 RepID=A0AAV0VFA1_9STRA|nr:unnamed protein product [Peronospora destructor]
MKFRFCGGLEPPDWLLAEMPQLSGTGKVTSSDLSAMCQAIGGDTTVQAAIAALRFILMQAAKYDTEGRDLVEELQQLGMHQAAAEAIAQSYEELRPRIQDQQRARRFRFPNVKKVEWKVETSSKVMLNLKLDQPVLECDMTTTTTPTSADLSFSMSQPKFLALYEELSQAPSLQMGSGSWVVQEGFLLCKRDETVSDVRAPNRTPTRTGNRENLEEVYVVLTMNRKLEFFDGSDAATRNKIQSVYLEGFAGWDGDGVLKADSYGLELKVERHSKSRMHLVAFNRIDLEKWCRGFMAVLDPQSAAGEEVRRERRRVKKEEKRAQEERKEKIRKWKEKKAKMIKEEQDRLLAREEEINKMTPLERVDGLGSLDDDTARMLEKRKLRWQRRQAPTTGRVNKAAYRRRMEEAAGGKTDNVQPLCGKIVEPKTKVRVELPPPGQFFEVGGVVHNDMSMRLGSSGSDVSDSTSMSSRLSSVSSAAGSRYDGGTSNVPPTPPRWSVK